MTPPHGGPRRDAPPGHPGVIFLRILIIALAILGATLLSVVVANADPPFDAPTPGAPATPGGELSSGR